MNKLSKIFLSIIIILVIALILSIYFCFKIANDRRIVKEQLHDVNDYICEVMRAIENKGLQNLKQEDGTFILAEREYPIEEVID